MAALVIINFKNFEHHRNLNRWSYMKLWGDHFWSPSYFIATTGNVSIDVLEQYIEEQRGRLARED
ncbi:MAG: transposase [Promethearchaeota archaeon]